MCCGAGAARAGLGGRRSRSWGRRDLWEFYEGQPPAQVRPAEKQRPPEDRKEQDEETVWHDDDEQKCQHNRQHDVMPSRRIVVPRVMVVRRGDFLSKDEVGDEKCKSPRCVNRAIAVTRVESEPAGCRVPYLPPLGLMANIPTQLVNQVSSLFCHSWFAKLGAAFDCAAPPGKPFTVLTKRFSRLNRPVSSKKGVSPCRLQAAAPI